MSKKVKFLRFKDNMSIPGKLGEIGQVLPSDKKTIEDLSMTAEAHGIVARMRGEDYLLPYELIKYAILAKDNEPNQASPEAVVFNTKAS